VKIDARTGTLPNGSTEVIIDEAFRPGTEPGSSAFASSDDCLSIFGNCDATSDDGSIFGVSGISGGSGETGGLRGTTDGAGEGEEDTDATLPDTQPDTGEDVAGEDLSDIY